MESLFSRFRRKRAPHFVIRGITNATRSGKWEEFEVRQPSPSAVHVLPVNDLIDHEAVGDECACGPDVEFVEGGRVISHHSLDGREERENV